MHSTKQLVIIVIITAIIFAVFGLYCPKFIGLQKNAVTEAGKNTFQAGWNAAKQRLIESGFMPMVDENMGIKQISGEVKGISKNKINLKIHPLEPLSDPSLDVRIIEINNNTKIYQLEEKDIDEYQKEMEEFNKTMEEQMENPESVQEQIIPPEPFDRKQASLADIKIGMQISVEAEEDIKNIKEFKAAVIIIQSTPNTPTAINAANE